MNSCQFILTMKAIDFDTKRHDLPKAPPTKKGADACKTPNAAQALAAF